MTGLPRARARYAAALAWLLLLCATAVSGEPRVFSGVIDLAVDATDLDRRVIRVRETIPVTAGKLTLLYPQWVPGNHAPTGAITLLAGLTLSAAGKPLSWTRDGADMYAFHVDVPEGVGSIEAQFQYLSPLDPSQGRFVVTPNIIAFQWHTALLYPAGYASDDIPVHASIVLPEGWRHASSLDVEQAAQSRLRFRTTSLTRLVDSPVWAGRYFESAALGGSGGIPVTVNVFGDLPENVRMEPRHVAALGAAVEQTYKVFGAAPYPRYEFLLSLSSSVSRIGLEHQGSTEISTNPDFFARWNALPHTRSVFVHEFVHTWNGKRYRPADLATPHFNEPMANSLLWVYEGQTQFWTYVLAARSGVLTPQQTQQAIARSAAYLSARSGRAWRNLQDTNNDPIMRPERQRSWASWQRGVDYYDEGLFMWLEADALILRLTAGERSLDDFARRFFGRAGTGPVVTYTFEDVVANLNAVASYDWASFLRERLDSNTRDTATEALKSAGWQVVYREKPNAYGAAVEREEAETDFFYSVGFTVGRENRIMSVQWESAAFKAGVAGGGTLLAVNGRAYRPQILRNAIASAKESKQPIELLIKSGDWYRTHAVEYFGGLRYPHLEPLPGAQDLLTKILAPLQ